MQLEQAWPSVGPVGDDGDSTLGEMVADAWSLGDELTAVIEHHHDDDPGSQLTRVVQLASAVDELRTNPAQPDDLLPRTLAMAKRLGLDSTKLAELSEELGRSASMGLRNG